MPTFSIPLSGLTASSEALSTIANNLANLNTVGYKDQQTSFKDLFYQTLYTSGAGNPVQVGAGTALGANTTQFSNGNTDPTGVPTDVAITGDGFFITQLNGATQYTRAGNFSPNSAGQLCTQDGQTVMGYPAVNGVITAGPQLSPIALAKGLVSPPAATNMVQIGVNLNVETSAGTTPLSAPLTIYDSLGTEHSLTFQFTKTADNAWTYQATLPAADAGVQFSKVTNASAVEYDSTSAASGTTVLSPQSMNLTVGGVTTTIAIGTDATTLNNLATFINGKSLGVTASVVNDTNGSHLKIVSDGTPATSDLTMGSGAVVVASGAMAFDSDGKLISPTSNIAGLKATNLSDGASDLNLTWNVYDANGGPTITQTDAPSGNSAQYQNGHGSGTLLDFNVGTDGVINATFSNHQTMALGQIALAGFANTQGLERVGNNSYNATLSSGSAVVGAPGTGGRGSLQGGALEASNVDIAQEFTKMITTQRGYQANARVITTFDQITQDTVNLVR